MVRLTAPVGAVTALPAAAPSAPVGLRLKLSGEEPSGVYFDRDTLQTQTALVFSLRAWNDRPAARPLALSWRVQDAAGRVLWQCAVRLTMPPRGVVHRREMFEPQRLGAYRLSVRATAEGGGQRGRSREAALAALPFAVVAAPATGLRPHSFFSLSTPALLSSTDLDFYARIGARVLRSPWVTSDGAGGTSGIGAASPRGEAPGVEAPRDFGLLDRQLQARLRRGIATRGVLPVLDAAAASSSTLAGESGADGDDGAIASRPVKVAGSYFAAGSRAAPRSLLPFLVRYSDITTWEFAGSAPPARWDALAREARATRSDIALLGPLDASAAPRTGGWDGIVVPLPSGVAPPAALSPLAQTSFSAPSLRALLGLESRVRQLTAATGAVRQLYFAQDEPAERDAMTGARAMLTRYMLGIVAGAAGMSAPLPAPAETVIPMSSATMDSWESGASDASLARMARAAVFSAMTRLLEDTAPGGELFPASPLLWGVGFERPDASVATGDDSRIAVLWADGGGRDNKRGDGHDAALPAADVSRARLIVRLGEARALDMFGNEVARSRRGKLVVPLGDAPVYVAVAARPSGASGSSRAAWTRAWREASVEGLPPLAAQVLALTQAPHQVPASAHAAPPPAAPTPGASPAGGRMTPWPHAPQSLRVRLQNVLHQPVSGVLRVTPPPGWQLAGDTRNFRLAAGESRVYGFAVNRSVAVANGAYPVTVGVRGGSGRWQWKQMARVATAQSVRRGQPLRVDGDLNDWSDAVWMQMAARDHATGAATSAAARDVSARVALRWDARRLYVAAQISEPRLQPRRSGNDYEFWRSHDALQLAFGLRDEPAAAPRRSPFRDTDYGFLLCPFDAVPSNDVGDASGAKIVGRLLRLWNPALPFDAARDRVRWGGVVPASQCVVRRDAARRVTIYEAVLPLTEMPALRPPARAERDVPVRFGWILHTDEGPALQWSRAAGVFPWWGNTASFLPAQGLPSQGLPLAAQTPLGFTQSGPVDDGGADDGADDGAKPASSAPPQTFKSPPARGASRRIRGVSRRSGRPNSTSRRGARRSGRKRGAGRRAPRGSPPRDEPPELAPMPPRVLPPARPSPGTPGSVSLPPAPVRNEPLPPLPPSP